MANTQKKFWKKDKQVLHIAFHPMVGEDFQEALQRLNSTMDEAFSTEAKLRYSSEAEGEIIYTVQKPIVVDEEGYKSFFQTLRRLFEKTDAQSPHFTQYYEEDGQ